MVVLHTETLKRWGGQQNRVLTEAVELNRRGHKAVIACHRSSVLAEKSKQAGVKVYEVNMVKQAHLKTIPELIRIIKSEKVDIVSTHSSVDSWAGGLAAKLAGKRLFRFRHNLYPIGRDPLTKFIYAIPDRIITISRAISDLLTASGLKKNKLKTIHSSVNMKRFDPMVEDIRKELDISPESLIIGNTSTFMEVKGQEYLLQAFNIINKEMPCYLLFAGSLGEAFQMRYLSHVEESMRNKVIFLGHRDDIPRILKTIDIFVYPSFLEGLGTALLEAMTMGMPVAVADIPTFRDFIEDGVSGLFFRPKNSVDLAEKVLYLIQNSGLREQLGHNARSTALEKFSINEMMDQTESQYMEVLNAV